MNDRTGVILILFVSAILVSSFIALTGDITATEADEDDDPTTMNNETVPGSTVGTGSAVDPYQISDIAQLQDVKNNLSANYTLMNDIDAEATEDWNGGSGFEPIGGIPPGFDPDNPDFDPDSEMVFSGSFDGNGYVINGLHIERPDTEMVGLFSIIGETGTVSSVGLKDIEISGESATGALAGINQGTVQQCNATGNITGEAAVGGLIGMTTGDVTECYSSVVIQGSANSGGLIGVNDGNVSGTYATGTVSGEGPVGGLVGVNGGDGVINDSHATGDVDGDVFLGGLIGMNNGTVSGCYAIGDVDNSDYLITVAGGLIASSDGSVADCYATGDVNYAQGSTDYNAAALGGLLGINDGTLTHSYSTGKVTGDAQYAYFGGLVGLDHETAVQGYDILEGVNGTTTSSFWDRTSSEMQESSGGEWKSNAEMRTADTFTDAGWNLSNIWSVHDIYNHGYPYLQWEYDEASDSLVRGSVVDEDGDPVEGMAIMVDGYKFASTDENGDYVFATDPGVYDIEILKDGYESETLTATGEGGDTTSLDTVTVQSTTVTEPDGGGESDDDICMGILVLMATCGIVPLASTARRR